MPRGLSEELVREYFARNVTLELGEDEYRGLQLFLQYIKWGRPELAPFSLGGVRKKGDSSG